MTDHSEHVSPAPMIGMIRNTSVSHGFGAGRENRRKIELRNYWGEGAAGGMGAVQWVEAPTME